MDTDKKELGAQLAYAALDEVPTPKLDAKEIVALVFSYIIRIQIYYKKADPKRASHFLHHITQHYFFILLT